jgi:hypothetical protein
MLSPARRRPAFTGVFFSWLHTTPFCFLRYSTTTFDPLNHLPLFNISLPTPYHIAYTNPSSFYLTKNPVRLLLLSPSCSLVHLFKYFVLPLLLDWTRRARHWLFASAALDIDICSVFGPAGRALKMIMAWEVGVSDGVELGDEGEKVGG